MLDSPTSSDPVLASGVNLGAVGEESEVPVPAGSLPSEVLGSWTLAAPSLVGGVLAVLLTDFRVQRLLSKR